MLRKVSEDEERNLWRRGGEQGGASEKEDHQQVSCAVGQKFALMKRDEEDELEDLFV